MNLHSFIHEIIATLITLRPQSKNVNLYLIHFTVYLVDILYSSRKPHPKEKTNVLKKGVDYVIPVEYVLRMVLLQRQFMAAKRVHLNPICTQRLVLRFIIQNWTMIRIRILQFFLLDFFSLEFSIFARLLFHFMVLKLKQLFFNGYRLAEK